MDKDKRIYVRLSGDLKDKFQKVCKAKGTDASEQIRKFIKQQVAK